MSVYESSITNPKKQLEFYKDLSEQLQQKNQELKNQLEEYRRLGFKHLNDKCNKLLNQQKEFIEYLENEINKIEKQIIGYDIWHEVGTDINFLILKKQFFIEILSRYREIIRGKE